MSRTARLAFPLRTSLETLPVTVEIIRPLERKAIVIAATMTLGLIPLAALALAWADGEILSAAFFFLLASLPAWPVMAIWKRARMALSITWEDDGVSVVDRPGGSGGRGGLP